MYISANTYSFLHLILYLILCGLSEVSGLSSSTKCLAKEQQTSSISIKRRPMDETTSKYFKKDDIDSSTNKCEHSGVSSENVDLEQENDKDDSQKGSEQCVSDTDNAVEKNNDIDKTESEPMQTDKSNSIENNDQKECEKNNVVASISGDTKEKDDDNNNDGSQLMQTVEYCEKDFETDTDHDSIEEDNTDSEDMMGASNSRGKKKKESGPEAKKYKQSKLSFSKTEPKSTRSKEKLKKEAKWSLTKRWSDKDTQNYRDGYPGKKDDPSLNANLKFYTGKIRSSPDGDYIDVIHEDWWGQHSLLERHHGYIQWLFPIREDGMNWQAQALQLHEAQGIKADPKAAARVLRSYEMMLDFYGMKLTDAAKGTVARSGEWRDRFDNLSWSSHNYLRITRILKSLGELGLEHLKKPWLQFLLHEALVTGMLSRTLTSCRDYWVGTVRCEADRMALYGFIEEHS